MKCLNNVVLSDKCQSIGKPTLKERLQHSVHELTDAISVYHQMAKEVPKTISATPSPTTPDLNLSNSMITVNTPENAGFLLSPSFSNTPPIVPPVLLVDNKGKINNDVATDPDTNRCSTIRKNKFLS